MRALISMLAALVLSLGACAPEQRAGTVSADGSAPAVPEVVVAVADDMPGPRGIPDGFSQSAKAACEAGNGNYQRAGRAGRYNCITPYADAGKVCRAANECEGQCRVELDAPEDAPGKCQADSNRFGCYGFISETGERVGICVD
ncbi:hypothetical protein [Altererythrobacter aquiaggeris]|uniref:hypothetical protein n=1 Tax=Aestuarierythrobacter aquiaggeris TaxID=1898396 RepID=UPI003016D89B